MSSSSSFGSGEFGSGPFGTIPFFSVSELITAILRATGHGTPTQEVTKRAAILQFLNNRYQDVLVGRHWRWGQASFDFNLEAPYSTGTISLTQGSQTVTGTGTDFSANIEAKSLLTIPGSSVVYHVLSVESTTSLTLETKFAEDDVTDSAFVIYQNQYRLPKEVDHIQSMIVDSVSKLVPLGVEDFRLNQSRQPTRAGVPETFALIRRDVDDDARYIEIYPAPDRRFQTHIDYTVRIAKLEDDSDCFPIIPDRYRSVLYYGALAEFYGFLRDPTNREIAEKDYARMLFKMQSDTQLTDQALTFTPARNYRTRRGRTRRFGITMSAEEFGRFDD